MRLLLDESVPRPVIDLLTGHEVRTVQTEGWAGVENGELLRSAADAGFAALVTVDAGFEYQQNLSQLPLTVLLLRARSNRLEDLEPLIPEALDRLRDAVPCSFQSRTFQTRTDCASILQASFFLIPCKFAVYLQNYNV